MNNEIEKLKLKICEKCRKSIQKNFVDCPFQSFDNEYCGDLEQIIERYIKSKEKESVIAELEKIKIWSEVNSITVFYNELETEIKEKHIVVDRPQENGSPSLIKRIEQQIKEIKIKNK